MGLNFSRVKLLVGEKYWSLFTGYFFTDKVMMFLWDFLETATEGVLWETVFLEILQNSQKNTCANVFLWILQNL